MTKRVTDILIATLQAADMKTTGLIPLTTALKNRDLGEVAGAIDPRGRQVFMPRVSGESAQARLAQPGTEVFDEGDSYAIGGSALAAGFAGGRCRDVGLHRQDDAPREAPSRLGSPGGEHWLINLTRTSAVAQAL
jgi:hypothetical protein